MWLYCRMAGGNLHAVRALIPYWEGPQTDVYRVFFFSFSRRGGGEKGEAPLKGAAPKHVFKHDPR